MDTNKDPRVALASAIRRTRRVAAKRSAEDWRTAPDALFIARARKHELIDAQERRWRVAGVELRMI